MPFLLTTLRQRTPQPTPMQFLAEHPGAWIQYYDDTAAKDPLKALSAPSFILDIARRKQRERCAVCFSLQAFRGARTKERVTSFRNLGVDVDLISRGERCTLALAQIEARKDEYLRRCLLPFPLKPHWIIETKHGFHAIFRIHPIHDAVGIARAASANRKLVTVLRGDENATLITQVLRVPGTYQWKDPQRPFLCRLLMDHASTVAPYDLHVVESVLNAWDLFHGSGGDARTNRPAQEGGKGPQRSGWREGLNGVPEGQRNATAAAVIGGIIGRLPEHLWETAGWGGLKEWNRRNAVPLLERELRSVFESIARREHGKRRHENRRTVEGGKRDCDLRIDIRIDKILAREFRSRAKIN